MIEIGKLKEEGEFLVFTDDYEFNSPSAAAAVILARSASGPLEWKNTDGKKLKACTDDIALIAGQKPIITRFKKSISNFKTRKGSNAGVKVTLRSQKMYEFIDRLVNIALPRIKDFRGLSSKGIDNSHNYSFGIKEHIVFPEVNFDKVDKIRGLDITIVTSSKSKVGTLELLREFNFPLNEKKN